MWGVSKGHLISVCVCVCRERERERENRGVVNDRQEG